MHFMGDHHALVLILRLKIASGYQHVQVDKHINFCFHSLFCTKFMAVGPTGDPGQRWDFAPKTVDLANSSLTGQDLVPTQSNIEENIDLHITCTTISNKDRSTKGSTALEKLTMRSEHPAIHTIVQVCIF